MLTSSLLESSLQRLRFTLSALSYREFSILQCTNSKLCYIYSIIFIVFISIHYCNYKNQESVFSFYSPVFDSSFVSVLIQLGLLSLPYLLIVQIHPAWLFLRLWSLSYVKACVFKLMLYCALTTFTPGSYKFKN